MCSADPLASKPAEQRGKQPHFLFSKFGRNPDLGCKEAAQHRHGPQVCGPDRHRLLYLATNDIRMDDGTRLEGKGVEPDIEVPFELLYAQGRDPRKARAIDEAARLVRKDAG